METNQEFFQHVSGVDPLDSSLEGPLGETVPALLPEPIFHKFVSFFRERVKEEISRIPTWKQELRERVAETIPPTFDEFLRLLKDHKDAISQKYAKGEFKQYKAWLLDEENLAWAGQAFFLERFAYWIPLADRLRHTYIVGESGSGKSELLKAICIRNKEKRMLPSWRIRQRLHDIMNMGMGKKDQANPGRALVLIDPHGNLADEVAAQDFFYGGIEVGKHEDARVDERLEAKGTAAASMALSLRELAKRAAGEYIAADRSGLVYINPLLDPERFPTINPFDLSEKGYRSEQMESYALHLARVFTAMLSGGNQTLSLQMETLLVPCITILLHRPGSTLFDLQRFMNDEGNADLVELGKHSDNPGQATFFKTLFSEASYKATKISIATKCQSLLNNRTFSRIIASPKSTVDLEDAINKGKAIVVNCAKGALGPPVAEAFGRFLVAMVMGIALNRTKEARGNVPIDLVIDECHTFISDDLETILAEARGYGLHLTLAQQVVGQGMNPDLTRMVLGNTGVKFVGKSGHHNRSAMGKEMGIDEKEFENLKIGVFVVKSGSKPPIKIHVTDDFLGRKTCMSFEQWEEVKRAMLAAYYQNQETPIQEVSQLAEDIAQSRQASPKAGPKAPKYEIEANPFSNLDL